MARKLNVMMCSIGLIHLVTSSLSRQTYDAGSSPLGARLEVHGVSTYPHGLPSHQRDWERKEVLDQGPIHAPTTETSQSGEAMSPETEPPYPRGGNWCSFVRSRVVTYVDLCKTDKFVIRSQQPCPNGTPDCQKIMYRHAQKPVYKVKQKAVTSLEWKCCPGYIGTSCDHIDPNSIHIPSHHTERTEEEQEHLSNPEVSEIIQAIKKQETLLEDIQNDIHQATSNLLDMQNVVENNITIASNENQTKPEVEDRLLREVFLPHVENFLREHFNPMWNSFNKSLQNLSSMVKNLSGNVETNRKRMDKFLENTVPKKDLHELGTKFESKIQENIVKLEQMKREMNNHFHTQQTGIHYNFTMIKADTDVKFKRHQKVQTSHFTHLNNSIADLRREQDIFQDDIQAINRNITDLWIACGPREGETTHITNHQINETLAKYGKQITDLFEESDATFDQISAVEKGFKELRTQFKNNADEVQMAFIEKSLIMEENKDFLLRQIMELNYTITNVQESDDLLTNCDCQKMTLDLVALEEVQRNFSNLLKDVLFGLKEVKQKEKSSTSSLQNSVEDLSMALQLNRQSLTAQQEQGRSLMHVTSKLKSQAANFSDDVEFLKKANTLTTNHIQLLDSSFSSLLEDAMRHERALEALLGDEILEVLSEDNPEALKMSILQIYEVLNETLSRLEKQQLTTDSIKDRMLFLELQPRNRDSPGSSTVFHLEQQTESMKHDGQFKESLLEHMEPNHEASNDDVLDVSAYSDIMTLKKDIKHLVVKVKKLESYFTDGNYCCNDTIVNSLKSLNVSVGSMRVEIVSLRELFGGHVDIFQKIFGNYEEMIASNITLDIAKVQALIAKKMKKNQRMGHLQNRKRDKKQTEKLWQPEILEGNSPNQDSPVAFSAGFSEGADGVKILRFNDVFLNYGNVFSLEDGHFTAPHGGVYTFAVSVDFGPGNALGNLVFGGRQQIALHSSGNQQAESIKHSFTVVELQKDEKVWFELLQGSIKKNSFGTTLAGYMIFKT
ncbi:hypothetical protein FKM82_015277 [Ascaphus truei]